MYVCMMPLNTLCSSQFTAEEDGHKITASESNIEHHACKIKIGKGSAMLVSTDKVEQELNISTVRN